MCLKRLFRYEYLYVRKPLKILFIAKCFFKMCHLSKGFYFKPEKKHTYIFLNALILNWLTLIFFFFFFPLKENEKLFYDLEKRCTDKTMKMASLSVCVIEQTKINQWHKIFPTEYTVTVADTRTVHKLHCCGGPLFLGWAGWC